MMRSFAPQPRSGKESARRGGDHSLAIPGVVLAVGYLRVFHGWDFPA
jgi:ABC-type Fe3+ transport system permease subunit